MAFSGLAANTLLLVLAAIITMYIVLGVLTRARFTRSRFSPPAMAGVGALLGCCWRLDLTSSHHRASSCDRACQKNAIMMIDFGWTLS